jgi:CheY-like chemotaxis protein
MDASSTTSVVGLTDGLPAVVAVRTGTYDAVIMDIQMPEMDGLQATVAIRSEEGRSGRPRLPILAVTASCTDRDRARCYAAGLEQMGRDEEFEEARQTVPEL